jgi:dihydrolipoamide dehydrogenase
MYINLLNTEAEMYDLIVIGGGPAGYTAAIRASQHGLKTALIEKDKAGGTCLNRGCIPTKALLHSAKVYEEAGNSSAMGISTAGISYDINKAYEYKDNTVARLRKGLLSLFEANNIDYIISEASFIDTETVSTVKGGVKGRNIIIATGSVPATIPVKGIEYALNSDGVLSNPLQGEVFAIIGGGVIGVEFATYLSSIGRSVYLIEAVDRLIPMMSAELSQRLVMSLKKKKVKIFLSAKLNEIIENNGKYTVKFTDKDDKEKIVDSVICCTGRRANISGLRLENAGLNPEGALKVNSDMYTGSGRIFAAGDVTGGVQLAHYAAAQGICAVNSILGLPRGVNLNVVPSCIYTHPEIATVGNVTEDENTATGKYLLGANGRAQIEQLNGYIKVYSDKRTDVLKGAEIYSPGATDIISEAALAIACKINVGDFIGVIHPHPTFSEGLLESVEDILGKAIHLMPKN